MAVLRGKTVKPVACVMDIQMTAAIWGMATGREGRADVEDPILIPRPGLGELLNGLRHANIPLIFYTDGRKGDGIKRALNDALWRLHAYVPFIYAETDGKPEYKNMKSVADAVRTTPDCLVLVTDTACSANDLIAARDYFTPVIHVPANPAYHDVPVGVIKATSFVDLGIERHVLHGFVPDVLDFEWQDAAWHPVSRSYQEVLERYERTSGNGHKPLANSPHKTTRCQVR